MFKRYKPFYKAGAMAMFSYKFEVFTWLIINLLQITCVLFLWFAIYKNSEFGMDSVINGFTFKQIIVYLTFINIYSFVTFCGDTLWAINEDIKKGTIDLQFTKPINYRTRFLFQTLGVFTVNELIFGLPLLGISMLVFSLTGFITIVGPIDLILHILLFLLIQVLACLINDTMDYFCGVLCFYTSSGWGINQTKGVVIAFLSGSLLPLSFFPGWVGKVVSYLPFAGMAYNPVMVLMGKADILTSIHYLGFTFSWLLILNGLAALLFNHASKKITVQGG